MTTKEAFKIVLRQVEKDLSREAFFHPHGKDNPNPHLGKLKDAFEIVLALAEEKLSDITANEESYGS